MLSAYTKKTLRRYPRKIWILIIYRYYYGIYIDPMYPATEWI